MNSAGDNDEQPGGGFSNDQVLAALKVVHDSKTPNPVRKKAEEYLQQFNSNKDAPYHGYTLAADKSSSPIARHYGLWMLDDAIRHHWGEYSLEQSTALREWAISLAEMVDDGDPSFIANKIAAIWVEIAKRSWVLDWMNMDELLVRLWGGSIALKNLVLSILETLSDDIFGSEDAAAGLRETDLNKAYVQIFTPAAVLAEHFPHRETSINVRYGGEGWLLRLSELLELFLHAKLDDQAGATCAVRGLSILKSVIGWIIPKALSTTKCFEQIFGCLASSHISVQFMTQAAVEVLYSLYYPRRDHSRFLDDEFKGLVCPMYQDHAIQLFNRIYEWSSVDSEDIDPDKYLLAKKFSEVDLVADSAGMG
ncbi:MAG: hypothetical protein LQ351_003938 [Letrouitia transgressa]|nr:MAG: hypothetical protein LQ351_003938 [Letrouitia transgressa]